MSSDITTLRLGTRGSLLARTQSRLIADAIEKLHPGVQVELVILKTTADQIQDRPLYDLGGKGLFTKEIEQALLANEIDLAVHSFKDVPVTMPLVEQGELMIVATPEREDPADVLVVREPKAGDAAGGDPLTSLPPGAKVGTTSLRRRCQLLDARPDLVIEPLRGNIDTRLKKLRDGGYDAIVLAFAGVHRAGLFDAACMSILPDARMLCAPGQGALAVQCRRGDERVVALLTPLNHEPTAACVAAERMVVAALGGDCHSPIAARATIAADGTLALAAAVGARGGTPPVLRAAASAPAGQSVNAVRTVVEQLEAQGVRAVLARDAPARA